MAKAKLIKGFTHQGRIYRAGDEFEGTDAEVETLTGQEYIKRKEGEKPFGSCIIDGPGRGANVSASSSGSTGDSFQRTLAVAKAKSEAESKQVQSKPKAGG